MTSVKKRIVCTLILLTLLGTFALAETVMSVQVKETQIRATPTFLGKILSTLAYGDRVKVLEEQRGWAKVEIPGGNGWVNMSALTKKRIVLQAGAKDVESGASSSEVALAGKGFNEQVEAQYKKEKNLDYTWVDRMETFVFPPDELVSFLLEGRLTSSEGGPK
jgi:uncharacterized protein YgiM (DUF1202 family)